MNIELKTDSNSIESKGMLLSNILKICMYFFLVYLAYSKLIYVLIPDIVYVTKKQVSLYPIGWVIESLILTLISLFLFLFVKRKHLTLIITLLTYSLFIVANIIKIKFLSTPIYLRDLYVIGDLVRTWDLFKVFIPYLIMAIVVLISVILVGLKLEKKEVDYKHISISFLFILTFTCLFSYWFNSEIRLSLYKNGIFDKKNSNLIRRGIKYGYLTNFTQAAFFINRQNMPNDYSFTKIKRIVEKYQLNETISKNVEVKPKNIIVIFAEAFTNPQDFGWEFKEPPLPAFSFIQNNGITGHVISPVYGGKSVNSEFEFMTGLTNRFTPIGSSPYMEFVNNDIPSLVRSLSKNGYVTNAIQVIKFVGFGYGKIYDYLGLDNKISLHKHSNINNKLDPSNKTVSSSEIAKKIIALTDTQEKSFVFTFPNSSHSPWLIEDYKGSNIQLINQLENKYSVDEISAYANSLNHIDLLTKLLIEEFTHKKEKTMIIILGDHQPSIYDYTKNYAYDSNLSDYTNLVLKKFSVPFGMWTNYDLDINNKNGVFMSMNLLPSYILDLTGNEYSGLMRFNAVLREKLQIISQIIMDTKGRFYNQIPVDYYDILYDYEVLQYDLLFGKQHSKKLMEF